MSDGYGKKIFRENLRQERETMSKWKHSWTLKRNKVRHDEKGDEKGYNLMDIFNELEGNRKR